MTHGTDPDDWLRARLGAAPGATIEVASATSTYGDLDARTEGLAAGFQALGPPGTPVGVLLDNRMSAIDTWFALVKAGLLEIPVNTAFRGVLLAHILNTSRAEVVVCSPENLGAVVEVLPGTPTVRHVVVDGPLPDRRAPGVAWHRLDDLFVADRPAPPGRRADDPYVVMYTSGTTGPSKGVVGTHDWALGISHAISTVMDYGPADRGYSMFPIYYVNARYAAFFPLLDAGASFVLDERFSASRFWDICRAKGITAFNYLGAVIPLLWKQPERADDSAHDVRVAFGAACPAEIWEPFEQRFGVRLVEGWGLTEVGLATANTPGHSRRGSCGQALPDWYEIELHDEDGRPVPPGRPGEAVLRPKRPGILFGGYHNMAEESLEAFRDLWFHTGDRLCLDGDGFYHFVDRVKDSMRRRGQNISSWEVEQVVNAHADVLESAAFAVPSELSEDEVMVAVVPRPGHSVDPVALVEHCRTRMADFAVPRYVRPVDDLPKTPSQRVEKYKLRRDGITADTVEVP
ncbi:MAG: AMP-binding protein [Acidimicrobiia bacterium]